MFRCIPPLLLQIRFKVQMVKTILISNLNFFWKVFSAWSQPSMCLYLRLIHLYLHQQISQYTVGHGYIRAPNWSIWTENTLPRLLITIIMMMILMMMSYYKSGINAPFLKINRDSSKTPSSPRWIRAIQNMFLKLMIHALEGHLMFHQTDSNTDNASGRIRKIKSNSNTCN